MPFFTHPRHQKLRLDSHSPSCEQEREEDEGLIKAESSPDSDSSPNKTLLSVLFPHFKLSSNRGTYLLALSGILALSLTILTIAVIFILLRQTSICAGQPRPQYTSCGSTPAEARSRNCKFDILSFAWQTPECYDAQLMTDFLDYPRSESHIPITSPNSGRWKFYTAFRTIDQNDTVPLEEALKGEKDLLVDWEFHVVHCTFMWRQMHRAFTVGGWIDSHLDSYAHTMHCQRTLLDKERSPREVSVAAVVRYPSCRSVHGGGSFADMHMDNMKAGSVY
ncbi:hypothetical protein V8F20_011976 [Naviculisporaceae sp. PSN 640]